MSNTNTARWIEESGVDPEAVREIRGEPCVWSACGRCGGSGYFEVFGHIDGGRCFACGGGKGSWKAIRYLAARARAAKRELARREKAAHVAARDGARGARAFLANHEGLAATLRTLRKTDLGRSFAFQLARKGSLSARQVKTAFRIAAEVVEKAQERLVEVPTGRWTLEGEIVSVQERETFYGLALKMLVRVQIADGSVFRVWGSVPRDLWEKAEAGRKVSFSAELEPRDHGFGWFKRPTRAQFTDLT